LVGEFLRSEFFLTDDEMKVEVVFRGRNGMNEVTSPFVVMEKKKKKKDDDDDNGYGRFKKAFEWTDCSDVF
jgi:hypothetical protein